MTRQLIKNMRRGGYTQPQGRMIMVAADEIERLRDRSESAEAVLRVVLAMLKDETHTRDDIEGYLERSMAIVNSTEVESSE